MEVFTRINPVLDDLPCDPLSEIGKPEPRTVPKLLSPADSESTILRMYDPRMARTTLRAKGQLTIPDDIRKAAHLEEGDLLEAEITAEGILLRPQKVIDATQAWFWTPEWQAGEREADADLAAGRMETVGSGEELIGALRSRAKGRPEQTSR
jgi:antitoxin PrlF